MYFIHLCVLKDNYVYISICSLQSSVTFGYLIGRINSSNLSLIIVPLSTPRHILSVTISLGKTWIIIGSLWIALPGREAEGKCVRVCLSVCLSLFIAARLRLQLRRTSIAAVLCCSFYNYRTTFMGRNPKSGSVAQGSEQGSYWLASVSVRSLILFSNLIRFNEVMKDLAGNLSAAT